MSKKNMRELTGTAADQPHQPIMSQPYHEPSKAMCSNVTPSRRSTLFFLSVPGLLFVPHLLLRRTQWIRRVRLNAIFCVCVFSES